MTGYHEHREYVRSNVSAQSLPFGVGSGMSALLSNVRARPLGDSRTLQSRLGFLEGVEHVVIVNGNILTSGDIFIVDFLDLSSLGTLSTHILFHGMHDTSLNNTRLITHTHNGPNMSTGVAGFRCACVPCLGDTARIRNTSLKITNCIGIFLLFFLLHFHSVVQIFQRFLNAIKGFRELRGLVIHSDLQARLKASIQFIQQRVHRGRCRCTRTFNGRRLRKRTHKRIMRRELWRKLNGESITIGCYGSGKLRCGILPCLHGVKTHHNVAILNCDVGVTIRSFFNVLHFSIVPIGNTTNNDRQIIDHGSINIDVFVRISLVFLSQLRTRRKRRFNPRFSITQCLEKILSRLDNAAQHPFIRAILGFTTTATTIEANARTWLEFPRCLVHVNTLGNERAIFKGMITFTNGTSTFVDVLAFSFPFEDITITRNMA